MREQTVRAIFNAVFHNRIVSAAVFYVIKRAVTHQAIKIFLVAGFMTRKKFAFAIAEEFVVH